MYDILIQNGTIVDGTGAPPRVGDVAIDKGRIVAVGGAIGGEATQVIDATGKIVTPGFIDIHTHYDGQVTWDDAMLPSSSHGVTTVVTGNCGIGFAPVRKGEGERLITLMEGVEDIPGSVLHEGLRWNWESFADYLDRIAEREYALDVATQVPHSAVRAYVMGSRANEPATDDDLHHIASIVADSIRAGAVGVGTSRIAMHQGSDGTPIPGNRAAEEELFAIARAMQDAGGGVFQMVPSGSGGNIEGTGDNENLAALGAQRDRWALGQELEMIRRLSKGTGVPITFSFAENKGLGAAAFAAAVDQMEEAARQGETVFPQFSARPTGILSTLGGYHAFARRPSYMEIAHLPLAERAARMTEEDCRAAILKEEDVPTESVDPMSNFHLALQRCLADSYALDDALDYEPDPDISVAAIAARTNDDPLAVLYDMLTAGEGRAIVMVIASNYLAGDLRLTEKMLQKNHVVVGLGDAGAHVRAICDASIPTFMLTHWVRDRRRGSRISLEKAVERLTSHPAALYGFADRGRIRPGLRADINVIDFERLRLGLPYLHRDLPADGARFLQDATGYEATIVNGVVTRTNDRDTGARPGRLVRGPLQPQARSATHRGIAVQIAPAGT